MRSERWFALVWPSIHPSVMSERSDHDLLLGYLVKAVGGSMFMLSNAFSHALLLHLEFGAWLRTDGLIWGICMLCTSGWYIYLYKYRW